MPVQHRPAPRWPRRATFASAAHECSRLAQRQSPLAAPARRRADRAAHPRAGGRGDGQGVVVPESRLPGAGTVNPHQAARNTPATPLRPDAEARDGRGGGGTGAWKRARTPLGRAPCAATACKPPARGARSWSRLVADRLAHAHAGGRGDGRRALAPELADIRAGSAALAMGRVEWRGSRGMRRRSGHDRRRGERHARLWLARLQRSSLGRGHRVEGRAPLRRMKGTASHIGSSAIPPPTRPLGGLGERTMGGRRRTGRRT